MSERWDFYFCNVDGKPASIFVDLGIHGETPDRVHPNLAFIRLFMRDPRGDGLSSAEEYPTLIEIEDALEAAFAHDSAVTYVGRTTTNGLRDYVFYVADPQRWETRAKGALAKFPAYRYECGSRSDPEWLAYREFLYPRAEGLQQILNRGVRDSLTKNGDVLAAPREIDHWAHFPSETARGEFLLRCAADGFALRTQLEGADGDGRFWLQIFRVDAADETLDQVTTALDRLATSLEGDYDGWESPVVP